MTNNQRDAVNTHQCDTGTRILLFEDYLVIIWGYSSIVNDHHNSHTDHDDDNTVDDDDDDDGDDKW